MTESALPIPSRFGRAAGDASGWDSTPSRSTAPRLFDRPIFWSGTNHAPMVRGASIKQRSRFAVEVLKQVRAAVGSDFPSSFA